jgi:hypothetical protein
MLRVLLRTTRNTSTGDGPTVKLGDAPTESVGRGQKPSNGAAPDSPAGSTGTTTPQQLDEHAQDLDNAYQSRLSQLKADLRDRRITADEFSDQLKAANLQYQSQFDIMNQLKKTLDKLVTTTAQGAQRG